MLRRFADQTLGLNCLVFRIVESSEPRAEVMLQDGWDLLETLSSGDAQLLLHAVATDLGVGAAYAGLKGRLSGTRKMLPPGCPGASARFYAAEDGLCVEICLDLPLGRSQPPAAPPKRRHDPFAVWI